MESKCLFFAVLNKQFTGYSNETANNITYIITFYGKNGSITILIIILYEIIKEIEEKCCGFLGLFISFTSFRLYH